MDEGDEARIDALRLAMAVIVGAMADSEAQAENVIKLLRLFRPLASSVTGRAEIDRLMRDIRRVVSVPDEEPEP